MVNFAKKILTGGYFNPLTIGHIRLFEEAATLGDLIVAVSNDEMCLKKSGYIFMPLDHRKTIISKIYCVSSVIDNNSENMVEVLKTVKPDIYVKGGPINFTTLNNEEIQTCFEIGCAIKFGVGGMDKIASSSDLIKNLIKQYQESGWC